VRKSIEGKKRGKGRGKIKTKKKGIREGKGTWWGEKQRRPVKMGWGKKTLSAQLRHRGESFEKISQKGEVRFKIEEQTEGILASLGRDSRSRHQNRIAKDQKLSFSEKKDACLLSRAKKRWGP